MFVSSQQQPDFPFVVAQYGSLFVAQIALAASVGNVSQIQLNNLTGSGRDVHLFRADASISVAGDILISSLAASLGTDGGAGACARLGFPAANSHIRSAQPAAVTGTALKRLTLPAGQSLSLLNPWEISIPPNQGVVIQTVAVNTALVVSFAWLEYTS